MMLVARYGRIFAGLALGGVSLFLTYHLRDLLVMDPNLVMRTLRAAAFTFVVPGLIAGIVTNNVHSFRLWVMTAINFLFWFGFGWLFATFVSKLIKLRRAIAAVGAPHTGAPADGSVSAGQGDGSSSLGSG